jgi:hypothetical protein
MNLRSAIDAIIIFTIKVIAFWFLINTYIFIQFMLNLTGTFGLMLDLQFFLTDIISVIVGIILFILNFYMLIVFSVLIIIFIFWMIIKIFVPDIIIVFIIIPIPIPIKFLILEYVPPFKVLTERGVLPLMERLMNRIISNDTIKNKFKNSFIDIYRFAFDEIKDIFGGLFNKMGINELEKPNEPPSNNIKIKTIDEDTDNAITAKKEIKNMENDKVMELINQELELCLASKTDATSPNDYEFSSITNLNNFSSCYATSIRAYLNNKI